MFGNDELNTEGTRSAKRSLDYLNRAQCAQQEGDDSLAASLYLAAFDCAQKEGVASENIFIDGLKQAWFLAASGKQRTLAEHIFSLMEPYLSQDEVQQYVMRLQDLALERLEEFGVDRGELEQVLSSIPSQLADMGFGGMDALFDEFLDEIEGEMELTDDICTEEDCSECPDFDVCEYHQANPALNDAPEGESARDDGASSDKAAASEASEVPAGDDDPAAASGKSGTGSDRFVIRNAGGTDAGNRQEHHAAIVGKQGDGRNAADASQAPDVLPFLSQILQGGHGAIAAFGLPGAGQKSIQAANRLTYADMAGFEHAIEQMHALGIGFANNPELKNFISFLNEKHGLSGMPVSDAIVFRSAAREDASRFMEATLGELELPGVRINVDENIHGDLVLCVMAQTSLGLRFNASKGQIDGSGVLLLEDIDLWGHLLPFDDDCFECASSRSGAQGPSKGALEAVRLIRSAVENPDVYVLASCSTDADIQGAFLDILEPLTVVDIDYPTASERTSLWNDLMNKHPSMKGAQIETLVACSKGLPRFDICMAAREAIEASYKESLSTRKYEPLTTAAICEKLAAYQPLDSDEYKSLEEQVVSDFRRELEGLDAFLGFEGANDVATLLGKTVMTWDQQNLTLSKADFCQLVWDKGAELYRDLPWRNTRDPYEVLVSEVMLQQTQVARVLVRWERFLDRFPTVDALASASTADVVDEWQGMGYNRRALALKRCADECAAHHDGTIPRALDALLALPGIGPATAAGVRAFSFDVPGVYLETNVRTVFLHELFPGQCDVSDKQIAPLVQEACPRENVRSWYYALLDYGAYLKRTTVNPSRRSKEYTRQSKFEGSRRQKRAEIVRLVLAAPGISVEQVFEDLNDFERSAGRDGVTQDYFEGLLADLQKEGFFSREDDRLIP